MLAFLSMLALLALLSVGRRGCYQQARAHLERKKINAEIQELKKTKEQMEAEKKSLNDPAVVKKIAREKCGMSDRGEKVYRVVPKEKK